MISVKRAIVSAMFSNVYLNAGRGENGRAAEDYVNPQGEVDDIERVRYLHTHLEAAARAIKDGASLAGYFVWSLLDNFEWAWGYQKRFGIVFVDFGTQRRIPKSSALFYSQVARANAVPAVPAGWLRLTGPVSPRGPLPAAPGGAKLHPTGDWLRHGGSYFDVRVIHETWSKGWQVHYWLAPLQVTCEEIFQAGFLIERLPEPRPLPEAAAIEPEDYDKLTREPRGFIAFRLVPRPA